MTPYAVLLVKPTDDDLTIRKRFHELSKAQHPDRFGAAGVPGPLWYLISEAYGQVKTAEARRTWNEWQRKLARTCGDCEGSGVVWKRLGKDKSAKLCTTCNGEGRTKK